MPAAIHLGETMNPINKQNFVTLLKAALQAANELSEKLNRDTFKAFVAEANRMAAIVQPFDYEVVKQLNALNQHAKKLGITLSSKPVRSNGHAQFF
ncbi:hypothetical protein [Methylomonas sp. MgM2]